MGRWASARATSRPSSSRSSASRRHAATSEMRVVRSSGCWNTGSGGGPGGGGGVVADDLAALHHQGHVLEQAYVGGGVTRYGDQVGVEAWLDAADPVRPAHQLGGAHRGRRDRLD